MDHAALIRLITEALLCPSLRAEELRVLHSMHLRLLADPRAAVTDEERERLLAIISDQRGREGSTPVTA